MVDLFNHEVDLFDHEFEFDDHEPVLAVVRAAARQQHGIMVDFCYCRLSDVIFPAGSSSRGFTRIADGVAFAQSGPFSSMR